MTKAICCLNYEVVIKDMKEDVHVFHEAHLHVTLLNSWTGNTTAAPLIFLENSDEEAFLRFFAFDLDNNSSLLTCRRKVSLV